MNYDNNRANQCNPNHDPSGPGRPAGYRGSGTKADLDNRSNSRNPNNKVYWKSRGMSPPGTQPSSNATTQEVEEEEESGTSFGTVVAAAAVAGIGFGLYSLFKSNSTQRRN